MIMYLKNRNNQVIISTFESMQRELQYWYGDPLRMNQKIWIARQGRRKWRALVARAPSFFATTEEEQKEEQTTWQYYWSPQIDGPSAVPVRVVHTVHQVHTVRTVQQVHTVTGKFFNVPNCSQSARTFSSNGMDISTKPSSLWEEKITVLRFMSYHLSLAYHFLSLIYDDEI